MVLQTVQVLEEDLVFVKERFVLWHAPGDCEIAEAFAVAGLGGVVVVVKAHRAEIADFVGVVMPAVVVTFGESSVLFVSAQITPPFRVMTA